MLAVNNNGNAHIIAAIGHQSNSDKPTYVTHGLSAIDAFALAL